MANMELARTIVGLIGNVISFFLFISPIQTFIKIYKAKSVQEFSPNPYLATVLNCAMWMFYGLPFVKPDSTLVLTINGAGFAIELIYVAFFFFYACWPKRRKIIIVLFVEFIFLAIVVAITMTVIHTTKDRSMVVGIICIIFNICMYASPLTIMGKVIKTKSVKYLPFYLSLANFCNGAIWMVYAILKFDANILIPNGVGTIFGAIQLLLYAIYYRTTNWDEEERVETIDQTTEPSKTTMVAP